MADRFVVVSEKLWTDAKFLALTPDSRLLFLWSWMPPHATVCGLYRASYKDLCAAIEPTIRGPQGGVIPPHRREDVRDRLGEALDELGAAAMLRYDGVNDVIWVVNRVRYAARTPKAVAYMQRELQWVPESPLLDLFLAKWGRTLSLEDRVSRT